MAAGIPQSVMNAYYRRHLQKIQLELCASGISSNYSNFELAGFPIAGALDCFRLFYRTLRASNGETAGMLYVHIHRTGQPGIDEDFGKDWDSARGIARIKELFARSSEAL